MSNGGTNDPQISIQNIIQNNMQAYKDLAKVNKEITDTIAEKGSGAFMLAAGAMLLAYVAIDQTSLNSLSGAEIIMGMLSSAFLMISGAIVRLYSSHLKLNHTRELTRIFSEERMRELEITLDKSVKIEELKNLLNIKSKELEAKSEDKVHSNITNEREQGPSEPSEPFD